MHMCVLEGVHMCVCACLCVCVIATSGIIGNNRDIYDFVHLLIIWLPEGLSVLVCLSISLCPWENCVKLSQAPHSSWQAIVSLNNV